jgi:membrane-associated phospholipid phosphatase
MTETQPACCELRSLFKERCRESTVLKSHFRFLCRLLVIALITSSGFAQLDQGKTRVTDQRALDKVSHDLPPAEDPQPDCSLKRLDKCFLNVAADQAGIWTSPLRFHPRDMLWFAPFAAAVGTSIHYDPETMQQYGFPKNAINFGHQVSRFSSPYVSVGAAGAMYLLGSTTHSTRLKHAGLLGAEAVADAAILTEGLKLATNRDRPYQGDGTGKFWPHGSQSYNLYSSMPSGHAAAPWALARVMSSEFSDKPWLKLLCYGAASTVSASRVLSRDHFPSDAVVGTVFGYLVGGYVVRHRSNEYSDSLSYSVNPILESFSHSYGLAVNIEAPELLHLGRVLSFRHSRFSAKE